MQKQFIRNLALPSLPFAFPFLQSSSEEDPAVRPTFDCGNTVKHTAVDVRVRVPSLSLSLLWAEEWFSISSTAESLARSTTRRWLTFLTSGITAYVWCTTVVQDITKLDRTLGQRNWISRNAGRLGVNSGQIKGDGRGRASERADRKVERKGIDLIQFDASSRPLDIA